MPDDLSNGYEAIADAYMAARSNSGVDVVASWIKTIPRHGSLLDVGAGHGLPLTPIFISHHLDITAIEPSPKLASEYARRFPHSKIDINPAERSHMFKRSYDAVISVGLIFLLAEDAQRQLIGLMAQALKPQGRLLFSAPEQIGEWDDILTGRRSLSLGKAVYCDLISDNGLAYVGSHIDTGQSHYYEALKPGKSS